MGHYVPSFIEPTQPDKCPTFVRTPEGVTLNVADPALAAELWPAGARVIKQDRGVFDTFPLSLITKQTIEEPPIHLTRSLSAQFRQKADEHRRRG